MKRRDRLVPLVGALNFRDLGGYPTADGRFTRWGRLFRSDSLHELTAGDVRSLQDEIGLTTVLDLRTPAEVDRSGRGLLDAAWITYRHLPVLRDSSVPPDVAARGVDRLADRYLWYLDIGRDALVHALNSVADRHSHPMVFHCSAGKDRTGVLAALVLDILGVQSETIVDDYALTASRMELVLARLKGKPDAEARIGEMPEFLLRAETVTMTTFLARLHDEYGGGREWAARAGVDREALDQMPIHLLDTAGLKSEA